VVFVWFKETARLLVDALITTTATNSKGSHGSSSCSSGSISNASTKKSTFINLVDDDDDDVVVVADKEKETEELLSEEEHEEEILRCECFTGDILKHEVRQALVDRFQRGELDVLVCTYGVGSTGITLTRSHTVILLDRPWTPGDAAQAEDRVRRIGQKSSTVESYWIEAFELDQKLDALLESKASNTAKVVRSNASLDDTSSSLSSSKGGTKKAASLSGGKQKSNSSGMKTITNFFAPLPGSGSGSGSGASSGAAQPSSAVSKGPAVVALPSTGSLAMADDAKFGDPNQEEVDTDSIMSAILKQLLR
jgi:Helicase conserved C-terminal domain